MNTKTRVFLSVVLLFVIAGLYYGNFEGGEDITHHKPIGDTGVSSLSPSTPDLSSGTRETQRAEQIPYKSDVALHSVLHLSNALRLEIDRREETLQLSPFEVNQLVDDYLEYIKVKSEIQARIATLVGRQGDTFTIKVPAYPEVGNELRQAFLGRLQQRFPPAIYEQIVQELSEVFENGFHAFGNAEQLYVVTKDSANPGSYRIEWSARLTVDDPASNSNYQASGGAASLTLAQIRNGDMSFLEPIVVGLSKNNS